MLLEPPRRAFLVQKREEIAQGHSKGSKNPENAIPKSMEKIRPKKYTKFIPKAFQNHAKTDTKIIDFLYFCEKGWNAPNCLFSNRKRGSGYLKCNKKHSWMYGQIRGGKTMPKIIKMVPKGTHEGHQNDTKSVFEIFLVSFCPAKCWFLLATSGEERWGAVRSTHAEYQAIPRRGTIIILEHWYP